jgi:hypothetical protein
MEATTAVPACLDAAALTVSVSTCDHESTTDRDPQVEPFADRPLATAKISSSSSVNIVVNPTGESGGECFVDMSALPMGLALLCFLGHGCNHDPILGL